MYQLKQQQQQHQNCCFTMNFCIAHVIVQKLGTTEWVIMLDVIPSNLFFWRSLANHMGSIQLAQSEIECVQWVATLQISMKFTAIFD